MINNYAQECALFEGSQTTSSELVLMLFGLMMKHRLTQEAMKDIMKTLSRIIPSPTDFPKTFCQLLSKIPVDNRQSSIHYYCPSCESNLDPNESENYCRACKVKYSDSSLKENGNFYVMFSVRAAVSSILEDSAVASELYQRLTARNNVTESEFIRDIHDGELYKKLQLEPFDITCSMNTDGVALFKSSKSSLWPILLSVNELSYKTRCNNTFIAGLWVGPKKPNFDSFFETFAKECGDLSANGVSWNYGSTQVLSKIYFPIMVCDSVARCLCQGIHQFNGSYGCSWCLNEGKSLLYGEASRKWIYEGTEFTLRTHDQFLDHIRELCQKIDSSKTASHYGVTTASQLLTIPKFNIVSGFTYDYMHSAFLGISRSLLNWWINSEYHDRAFYIGRRTKEIDRNLLQFVVPFCFDRTIRSIELLKFWKASEWRTWTFIAAIVLKNILPDPYLKHFSYFAEAIMLLSSSAIHKSEICRAEELIKSFVQGIPNLYGPEFCLYNFHIILHAPACVRHWGPLWSYSAFQYENLNGKIGRLLNGHSKVDIQLANKCDLLNSIVAEYRNCERTPNIEFGLSMLLRKSRHPFTQQVGPVKFYGPSRIYYFTRAEQAVIERHTGFVCKQAFSYKKCSVNGNLYTTTNEKSSKRRNCIVESSNMLFEIRHIFQAGGSAFAFGHRLRVRKLPNQYSAFAVGGTSPGVTVLKLNTLVSKFICGKQAPKQADSTLKYLVKLPNTQEGE